VAIAIPAVVAVGAYVLYVAGRFVDAVKAWQVVSPSIRRSAKGLSALAFAWTTRGWLSPRPPSSPALPVFDRRDIAAH
jgi:beta-exotoxin I transport system permease protein